MNDQWKERIKPARLERKYIFENYSALSEFLDQAAQISEKVKYFPDMGFGKDYVNVTINPEADEQSLADKHRQFAEQLENLFSETQH